ncbi:MAG TPA: serine/threonine-protein kinase [Acidobacteriota bacterium]|jgi:tRNA A-37 threonylcarbamoyl transferase component Bud32|nr:serine/threonine-protein kinase [Acidobacteriota bacterium]
MIGRIISHYRVLDKLGQGGAGVVYRAEDTVLGRYVALKVLAPESTRDETLRQRLKHEARAAASLSHPGIATVYGLEEAGDVLFIVYEYVRGETLRARMRQAPMDLNLALQIAVETARALAAAHNLGIVHRDLKPENIICCAEGGIKILDFGLARVAAGAWNSDRGETRITATGTIVGTVAYMSPEQIEGCQLDFRSDLFSFGILLYELVSGVHPFEASTLASTTVRILTAEPSLLSHLNPLSPPELDVVVKKCLCKDPASRYQATSELASGLERLCSRLRSGQVGEDEQLGTVQAGGASKQISRRRAPRWWWQFHQLFLSVLCCVMLFPLWMVKNWMTGVGGVALFLAALVCAVVVATLRSHLWFTSAFYSAELPLQMQRLGRWIQRTERGFAVLVLIGAVLNAQAHTVFSGLLLAAAIGILAASLIIEPATIRAAFGSAAKERE